MQERIPGIKELLLLFSWKNRAYVGPERRAEKVGPACAWVLSWAWPKLSKGVVFVVVLQTVIMCLQILLYGDREAAKVQTTDGQSFGFTVEHFSQWWSARSNEGVDAVVQAFTRTSFR